MMKSMAEPFTYPTYPEARITDHTDVYFGTTVPDPYRWMEDVDSAEVKQWVDAENLLTQGFLADVPARAKIHARLMELVNYERFSTPEVENGRRFYQRNSGLQNQAVLYWQQGEAEAAVLLDPNTLSTDGTISLGATSVTDDGTLLAYALAEAGSDLNTIRVRNVATGEDLPDTIGWVKFSGASWLNDGSGFFYASFGIPTTDAEKAEALKAAAYFHKLYFHQLGTPQTDDVIVFVRPDDGEIVLGGGVSEDGHWLVIAQGKGSNNALSAKDLRQPGAAILTLAPLADAVYEWIGNEGNTVWLRTNKDAPLAKIVTLDLQNPAPENWVTLVAETTHSLESATMAGGKLLLTYLVDAKSEVQVRALDGTLIDTLQLPGIGSVGVNGAKKTATETFYTFTNYTTPATIYRLDLTTLQSSVWKQPKLTFAPEQFQTTQLFATSKDGTQVPLFVTCRKGMARDGTAPTILYGYGGFSVSLGPAYSSSRMAWLEMGGVYAEAILRGGGEYGEAWHQAGTRLNKQNVFDDFIACAHLLIAGNYTSPARLAINGGSNGGLLVAACELQRPELFGAAIAQVGVMDMLRFDKFTIGYAWKPDYGSPSDHEAEFRANLKFSPVHNVHAGVVYPATLITTADHDDRVFPAHSFKFAAALQAAATQTPSPNPILIRIETRAGHGAGMPLSKQMDGTADIYAFLVKQLDMQPSVPHS
jgi:prolyl oligopeptidase